ncbi:MAG: hypothetical protein Q8Q85_09790 [Gemmatimonadales bacterium]|nr:hypothetical protein [Gemmatimonadales bacterium]
MILGATDFLPLAAKLGGYIKMGVDHYATLKAMDIPLGPEVIGVFLEEQMGTWDPVMQGRHALDAQAKHDGAMFLARVICSLAGPAGTGEK